MSAASEALAQIETNLLAAIENVTANPKPNYNIDGQQVSHADHLKTLLDALDQIQKKIRDDGDGGGQCFEFQTEIVPCNL
ncbi:MAG: hypothetical protein KF805_12475 [Phycisphaeraceae bacterium]|nr:hypothetical protein [Phycisphaeraceae bacterium]